MAFFARRTSVAEGLSVDGYVLAVWGSESGTNTHIILASGSLSFNTELSQAGRLFKRGAFGHAMGERKAR